MSVVFKPLFEFGFDAAHILGLQQCKHGWKRGGGFTLIRGKLVTDHILDVVDRFLLISKHRHITPLLFLQFLVPI